mgnify:CR=1 FL=1
MPGFLFTPLARWIGAGLLVLVLLGGVYLKGRHDVQVKFNAYKAEVKAVADAQEEKTRQIEAKNKRLNEETANAYKTQLAYLRNYYGMRNKGTSVLPPIPDSATGADEYSPDNLPAPAILASQCAETTLNLLVLQNWVRGVANNGE